MRAFAVKHGLINPQDRSHHDATIYDEDFDRQVDFGMRETLMTQPHQILESWLSSFMALGIPRILKILVTCSADAVRVDRIVNRDNLTVDEAKRHVFERERKNLKKWRAMYAKEWQAWVVDQGLVSRTKPIWFWYPELYDLTIDTFTSSKAETLKLALEKLGRVLDFDADTVFAP